MKLTQVTAAFVMASAAYSQTIESETAMLPSCALTCLSTAIASAGCSLADYACQCGSGLSAITKSATPCIVSGCSSSDALKAQSITTEICKIQAASGSSSSASSSVPASSSSMASSASSSSSAASSVSSESSSSRSSAASSASSATSAASSSAKSATSAAASSATSSSTPATSTGAAGQNVAPAFVAGAAMLAAFAL